MPRLSHRVLIDALGPQLLKIRSRRELARAIAAYMVDDNKQIDLGSLTRDIMHYRLQHGVIEAVAVSAHELPSELLDNIRDLLRQQFPNARSLTVTNRIDPAVIGGVRIELARQQLDMSVQAKLSTLKRLTS